MVLASFFCSVFFLSLASIIKSLCSSSVVCVVFYSFALTVLVHSWRFSTFLLSNTVYVSLNSRVSSLSSAWGSFASSLCSLIFAGLISSLWKQRCPRCIRSSSIEQNLMYRYFNRIIRKNILLLWIKSWIFPFRMKQASMKWLISQWYGQHFGLSIYPTSSRHFTFGKARMFRSKSSSNNSLTFSRGKEYSRS